MGTCELFIIAVSLAMDAFAVSICKGLSAGRSRLGGCLACGIWFGGFQALMPLAGWLLGVRFQGMIATVDHWIAFFLLGLIGFNMVRESRGGEAEELDCSFSPRAMLPLAVATSIDALAVGLSFSLLHLPIAVPALVIGVVCALISLGGMLLGARLGRTGCVRCWAGAAGGIALLGIGVRILYEHGVFREMFGG